jgi:hypothetical protein
MRIADFPFLIGEVDSGNGESDEVRLLLHASCIARFANALRKSKENPPIIISAIYFDGAMKARWHKVYQADPSQHVVSLSIPFKDPVGNTERCAGQLLYGYFRPCATGGSIQVPSYIIQLP